MVFLSLSRWIRGQYLQTGLSHLLSIPYLLSIHDYSPVSLDADEMSSNSNIINQYLDRTLRKTVDFYVIFTISVGECQHGVIFGLSYGCTKVHPKVSGLRHNEINNNNKHSLRSNAKDMAAKLTRLTHKIAIQLRLVAKSCTICNSRSRRPVRKLLDTLSSQFLLKIRSWITIIRCFYSLLTQQYFKVMRTQQRVTKWFQWNNFCREYSRILVLRVEKRMIVRTWHDINQFKIVSIILTLISTSFTVDARVSYLFRICSSMSWQG
jgi:hypothetical protein